MIDLNKQLYPYLIFLGAIPFVACAVLIGLDIDTVAHLGQSDTIMAVYGLTIISFLSGSHWGIHVYVMLNTTLKTHWNIFLPVISNTITLTAWFSYLALATYTVLTVLAIGFLILLRIDWYLKKEGIISQKYYHVRFLVSVIVVTSLICAAVSIF